MIAHDLWRDIIKYIPLVDLQDLSKASPMFDEVIYQIGYKVFYQDHKVYDLNDRILIKLKSGKKCVLWYTNHYYKSYKVITEEERYVTRSGIRYDNRPNILDRIYYDVSKGIAICEGNHNTTIIKEYVPTGREHRARIVVDKCHDFRYINLDTCIVLYTWHHFGGPLDAAFEDFTVLFKDNKWQCHSKRLD